MEKGNVLTKCHTCGKMMRVPVVFSAWNKPFESTLHECEFCGNKNWVYDPPRYNEDGTIENI